MINVGERCDVCDQKALWERTYIFISALRGDPIYYAHLCDDHRQSFNEDKKFVAKGADEAIMWRYFDARRTGGKYIRPFFPQWRFVKEIPQRIIDGDKAAYELMVRIIWIRRGQSWLKTLYCMGHELVHWLIDICGGGSKLQDAYDYMPQWMRKAD